MRRFRVVAVVSVLAVAGLFVVGSIDSAQTQAPSEAIAGFDGGDNGFAAEFCARQAQLVDSPNSPQIPDDECSLATAETEFTGPETVADGLGPIFNAAGCGECHAANPMVDPNDFTRKLQGATSAIMEKRAGFFNGVTFTDHAGGSLIQDRSIRLREQERVQPGNNVIAIRSTISVLGDGFVESVGNTTLTNISNAQPAAQRGSLIAVPVLERPGTTRIGRFGHKDQQASMVS